MNELYNKHYIRLDRNNYIIKGFSDAFENPTDTDICVNEKGGRHFELLGLVNPSLINLSGCHLYKYSNGLIIETTAEERNTELESLQKPKAETLEDKVNNITIALANMMGA